MNIRALAARRARMDLAFDKTRKPGRAKHKMPGGAVAIGANDIIDNLTLRLWAFERAEK